MATKSRHLIFSAFVLAALFLIPSCGYRLGGYKPRVLEKMQTFNVTMMANYSLEPEASVLISSALADTLQRDGTYRLTARGESDFRIEGEVSRIGYSSLRTNTEDTYLSDEISMNVTVKYRVVDNSSQRTLIENSCIVSSSYYNSGNVQTARANALSYAAQLAAQRITEDLTNG